MLPDIGLAEEPLLYEDSTSFFLRLRCASLQDLVIPLACSTYSNMSYLRRGALWMSYELNILHE